VLPKLLYGNKHRGPRQICINILSRYRTSYSHRIILCSHG